MKKPNPKGSASKLSQKELDELTREMLRNLSDADVRERVDAAERQMDKKIEEAFSKSMLQKEKDEKSKGR